MFKTKLIVIVILTVCINQIALSVEWQWSIPVKGVVSPETNENPQAFLWIPANCSRVRAVIVGQHNMEEEPIFEHPAFRKAMSEFGVAEVWVTPCFDPVFNFNKGAGEIFTNMMKDLAVQSGYQELEFAPIIPIGHSAMASYPWNFAAWNPARTLAAISVSGQWPYYSSPDQPVWGEKNIDGVPGLVTMGEYEWAFDRAADGLKQRKEHPKMVLSMLAETGGGHFDASDAKVAYIALYIKKALQYRLPADVPLDKPVVLNAIDSTAQGWLADRGRKDMPPKFASAPVGKYTGDANDAFWYFDEELAKATDNFCAEQRGKKVQLLGYIQDGNVVAQNPKTHQQVTLKFLPMQDGVSFKLVDTYLDTVPEGRPEKWTGLPKDSAVTHAASTKPIVISRICGPVVKTGPDTFAISFYRMGMTNKKRSNDIWLLASFPGDGEYKRIIQQSQMRFPLKNTIGAEQHITFPVIGDQKVGTKSVKLQATSDANMPIYYYVKEGPAEIEGSTLKFTSIPPRSKFPVKVTVVAWQWGRSIDPKLKTAEPVQRTFYIVKGN